MASLSEVLNIFITVFGILVIVSTVVGNSLVILSIIIDKRLRRVGNIFIISLAISDILVGVLVAPFALVYQLSDYWPFGGLMCDLWISLDVSCCTASIVNLCIISYDRYNAITNPLKYARYRTGKRAFILITVIWMYSIAIAIPPLIGWGKTPEKVDFYHCEISQDIGYTFYSTIGAFYLPLFVMLYFYLKIFNVTNRRGQQWERGPGSSRRAIHMNFFRNRRSKCSERLCCKFCSSPQESNVELAEKPSDKRQSISSSSSSSSFSPGRTRRNPCDMTTPSEKEVEVPVSSVEPGQIKHDIVIQVTQGRRKQTIQRRCLMRQISNVTSSGSSYTTSTGTSTTGISETSFSDSSDTRARRRVSNVLNNLVAANILEIATLQEGFRSVRFTQNPQTFDTVGEEDENLPESKTEEKQPEIPKATPRTYRRRKRVSLPQERRAVRTLGMVVGCFIVCWLPFFVVTILKPLCQSCNTGSVVFGIVLWLGYLNSACNPVIYTFFNNDFRAAFKRICCCNRTASPTYL